MENLTGKDYLQARDTLAQIAFVYLKNSSKKPTEYTDGGKFKAVIDSLNDLSEFKTVLRLETQRHEAELISAAKVATSPRKSSQNDNIKPWHYAVASLGLLAFGAGWLWLVVKVVGALF